MNGLLVLDKPEGPTSHDVVARVRRLLGESRVGHTGTLDPLASGVLPLLIGPATRLARFVTAHDKRYLATVRLGYATTTGDRAGDPLGQPAARIEVTAAAAEAALARFRGTGLQRPPAFSAKSVGGQRAYAQARRGRPVDLAPVPVVVRTLTLERFSDGLLEIDLVCSAGFYVRSLAHDLGTVLGCGAHLAALRRVASGPFDLGQAITLSELEREPERAAGRLVAAAALLPDWPLAELTGEGRNRLLQGRLIRPQDCATWPARAAARSGSSAAQEAEVSVRLVDATGALAGLGAWIVPGPGNGPGRALENGPLLHPRVVLVYD
jgi:tRNA pseudouridine55 synthase